MGWGCQLGKGPRTNINIPLARKLLEGGAPADSGLGTCINSLCRERRLLKPASAFILKVASACSKILKSNCPDVDGKEDEALHEDSCR